MRLLSVPAPIKIKICGITSVDDALSATQAGADALGLNFYSPSQRYINIESARQIAESVEDSATLVGLFVNHPAEQINDAATGIGLAWVQLHGDESPDYLPELDDRLRVMRAYRVDDWCEVLADLNLCRAAGRVPDAVLLDANVVGSFGGTGKTANWSALAERDTGPSTPPLILAGGLTPENVAEAIRTVRPAGIDVASGVEKSPGVKDLYKMQKFIDEAKSAFDSL